MVSLDGVIGWLFEGQSVAPSCLRGRGRLVHRTPGIPSIHRTKLYRGLFGDISLPRTEAASDRTLVIPLHPRMAHGEQDRVAEALAAACRSLHVPWRSVAFRSVQ